LIARKPLQIFLAVQQALFLRELNMRFSTSKMGLFWTFFEPFFQILVFVVIKTFLFGDASSNFDFAVFIALNFTAYNMFKNIVTKSIGSFTANKGLFVYKQVKPIDTIIARAMVETFITGIIILLFVAIGNYFNFDMNIKDLPMVTFGFLFLLLFTIAFSIFIAVANTFYPSIGKVISLSMIFLMFGSALFYTVEMLPIQIQDLLLLNPLTHFMELIHGYYFHVLDDKFVDYGYIILWTLTLLLVGLWFYRKLEERIISI